MRIVAGDLKGRKLVSFSGVDIRPTSDKVREAVFNILGHQVRGAAVIELFAGTGAFGFEALSRGASHVVFVDISNQSIQTIRKNAALMKLTHTVHVIKHDLSSGSLPAGIHHRRFDLVFLDPPYKSRYLEKVLQSPIITGLINENTTIIAEHALKEQTPESLTGLDIIDQRAYGKTAVTFFKKRI